MDEARFSFNVPLPKASQFDASATVTVRGDSREEFERNIESLFGEGTLELVTAKILMGSLTDATPAQQVPAPAPVQSNLAGDGVGAGSVCPQCNVGTLIRKQTKDGKRHFVGCNSFPSCAYIL